jgi:hypothetical protein
MTDKPGPVVAGTLNRPDPSRRGVLGGEPNCLRVPTSCRGHRPLRDKRARGCRHNCEHMLISMGIHTDHVIHLVCHHRVSSSGLARRVSSTPV